MTRNTVRLIVLLLAVLGIAAAAAFVLTRRHGELFEWVHRGGYPVLFLLLFSCGLGLPLPEDVPLIFSGILVQMGDFSLGIVAVVAWCGIIGGDCVLYLLGYKFGHDIVKVPLVGRHINAARLATVETWFTRWGVWVVGIGRLFAGVRGAMVAVAGVSKFNFWKFLAADGIAAIISGGLFVFLGYKFAEHQKQLFHLVREIKGGMLIGGFVLAALIIGYMLWRKRGKSAQRLDGLAMQPKDAPGGMGILPISDASPDK